MIHFRSREAEPQDSDLCLVFCPPGDHSEISPISGAPQPQWGRHDRGYLWSRADLSDFSVLHQLFLGDDDSGNAVWVVQVRYREIGCSWFSFRTLLAEEDDETIALASRAAQILYWDNTHRYCGTCATETVRNWNEFARTCPKCRTDFYPRINPAVIMLVHRENEILLARHKRSTSPIFSCLAGYVEAGETLEEAVRREVYEEVGVRIEAPRYWTSQSWPFPNSLMVAFFAPWVSGEPRPDGIEIIEANWYNHANLPAIPPQFTIAGRLISHFFEELRS